MTITERTEDGRLARGRATRRAFRDAAIECLAEFGYARTTTAEISRRAGVSSGLFIRYWPTKVALLVEAGVTAQRRGFAAMGEHWSGLGGAESPVDVRLAGVAYLLEMFDTPAMRCLAELQVAARTDDELRVALNDAMVDPFESIMDIARSIAPTAERGHFDARFRTILDIARGVSLRTSHMSPAEAARTRAETMAVIADVFELPA